MDEPWPTGRHSSMFLCHDLPVKLRWSTIESWPHIAGKSGFTRFWSLPETIGTSIATVIISNQDVLPGNPRTLRTIGNRPQNWWQIEDIPLDLNLLMFFFGWSTRDGESIEESHVFLLVLRWHHKWVRKHHSPMGSFSRLGSKIFCMVCFGTGHRAQHCPESRHGKGHRTREDRNLFSKRQLMAGFISFICFVYRREMILKFLGQLFLTGIWPLENSGKSKMWPKDVIIAWSGFEQSCWWLFSFNETLY
jgi:hypothetical protein